MIIPCMAGFRALFCLYKRWEKALELTCQEEFVNISTMSRLAAALKLSVCSLAVLYGLSSEANAAVISITYSLSGTISSVPIAAGTTLTFDSTSTLSILSDNSTLNASWNPVTGADHNVVDFSTGLNNATFTWTFAGGDKLFGTLLEDVSHVDMTGVGPVTETFTFTGGTGEFSDASGSVSGSGVGTASGFTSSGSGTINAPAVPEPAPSALLAGGFAFLLLALRRSKASVSGKIAS